MRLAHHLWRDTSGIWYFRWVVPRRLREVLGRSLIKQSLRTRDPAIARAWAYLLSARYAQIFATARGQGGWGVGKHWDDDAVARVMKEIAADAPGGVSKMLLEAPDGWRVQTNGTKEDNDAGLEALRMYLGASRLIVPTAAAQASNRLTLAEAVRDYGEVEAKHLKPNTWSQRSRALNDFAETIGDLVRVDAITRAMASRWSDGLLRAGKSKVYVANCVSHVAQMFEALLSKGRIQINPVKGLVVVKKNEKAARRSEGHEWEPFELPTIKQIFDPKNFVRVRTEHVRWGALIALYTGARVGEVAQIFLRDFVVVDGIQCVKICADSDGQGIKTGEGGERLVPLHPDLITLGLWERVEALRSAGAERLFPAMRIDSAAGRGNAISKGFSYYLSCLGVKPRRAHGIVGIQASNLRVR